MCCNEYKYYFLSKEYKNKQMLSDDSISDDEHMIEQTNKIYSGLRHDLIIDSDDERNQYKDIIVNLYGSVPQLLYFKNVFSSRNYYALTITMNIKHPDYKVVNDPLEFKQMLDHFISDKYKSRLDGILEYHKPEGALRHGGLHFHGTCGNKNPPKNNKDNLFYFHTKKLETPNDLKNWINYCKKNISKTLKIYESFNL